MNTKELIAYFESKQFPELLRLDWASTQLKVKDAVKRNIETMLQNTSDGRAKDRWLKIMNALKTLLWRA